MKKTGPNKFNLPFTPMPLRPPKPLLGILAATILLAILTFVSTYNNIRHEQDRMEQLLYQKGETIIAAIEAGSRTSMMHHMGSSNSLHTLLNESLQENSIAFIRIINQQGKVVDKAGRIATASSLSSKDVQTIFTTQKPVAKLDTQLHLYVISKLFQPIRHDHRPAMSGRSPMMMNMMQEDSPPRIISVGLVTDTLEDARSEDVHHSLIMGAILFLIGSAGIYFIFLYQDARVARINLSDLKLYTDNVIESMPAGLITLNTKGQILSCNHMSETIFGKSRNQLLQLEIETLLAGSSFTFSGKDAEFTEQSGEIFTNDGRSIPLQISGSALLNTEDKIIGTVLIIRDMSLFRDMEQQLERSRRMVALGKMAAGIAHEIRNPLGTLRGFAQYFCKKKDCSEEDKEYANLMVSEVDRLNRTVSSLLQFARPRDPQQTVCSLDELLAKTATLMKNDFSTHRINFQLQEPTGLSITCDPDLLLQVLMNLLQNSIHATSPGGDIALHIREEEQYIRVSVADKGRGMNQNDREKMFDPFFTTSKKGTGLGLAVSHQIIEQHNGFFEVETAVDEGTTVTIVLPKKEVLV